MAPYITSGALARFRSRQESAAKASSETARKSPHLVVEMWKNAVSAAPEVAARVKEDLTLYRELRKKARSAKDAPVDVAAE